MWNRNVVLTLAFCISGQFVHAQPWATEKRPFTVGPASEKTTEKTAAPNLNKGNEFLIIAVPDDLRALKTLAFSANGRRLAGIFHLLTPTNKIRPGSSSKENVIRGSSLVVWSTDDGKQLVRIDNSHAQMVLAISSDGKLVAGASVGRITVWDAAAGKITSSFQEFRGEVRQLSFSHDASLLLSLSSEQEQTDVCQWDLTTGKLRARLVPAEDFRFRSFALSADAKTLVLFGSEFKSRGVAQVWDLPSRKMMRQVTETRSWIDHAALSSDGKLLALSLGMNLHFSEAATGKSDKTLNEYMHPFAFHGGGTHLVGVQKTSTGSEIAWIDLGSNKLSKGIPLMHRKGAFERFLAESGRSVAVVVRAPGRPEIRLWDLDLIATTNSPSARRQ